MNGLVAAPGLFRAVLALAVVASHVSALEIGRLAVLMFFFLSGFWVTRLWETRYAPDRLAAFYGSRWFRIWPLYILCAAGAALAAGQALRPVDFSLLGIASSDRDPLYVAWSLDIELQFYLLLPALAWLLSRNGKVAATMVLAAATAAGWLAFWHFGIVTVAQYIPAFALGMITYLGKWQPSRRMAHLSLAAFLAFTVATHLIPYTSTFLVKDVPDPFHRDIFSFFWMLPILPYIAHSLTLPSGGVDRKLGDLSYPIYLVHAPIVMGLQQAFGVSTPIKVLAIGLSLAVAVAVYFLADRPFDAMRQMIFESRRSPIRETP